MYHQAGRGILHLCRHVTSEEVCFVHITVVSFWSWRALLWSLYAFMCCRLFLLFMPLCRPLVVRWCIWRSPIPAASLKFYLWILLCPNSYLTIFGLHFLTEVYFLSAIIPCMAIVDLLICSRFPAAFKWVFRYSNCKCVPEAYVGRWFVLFTIAIVTCRTILLYLFFLWTTGRSFLLLWVGEWTFLSHLTCFFEVFAMRRWKTVGDLVFQMDFSCLSGVLLLQKCVVEPGFLIDFLCPSLSLPGHVQKNMFLLFSTSIFDVQERQSSPWSSDPFE